jgi:hypothetical protein
LAVLVALYASGLQIVMCRCAGSEEGFWGLVGKLFLPDGNSVFGVLVGFVLFQHVPSYRNERK